MSFGNGSFTLAASRKGFEAVDEVADFPSELTAEEDVTAGWTVETGMIEKIITEL